MKKFYLAILCTIAAICATGQPRQQKVQIILVPESTNAIYQTGEKATVKVFALHQGVALEGTG